MSTSRNKKINLYSMAETAVLIAIVLIMGNTPLGTIVTPVLSVSIVTIPVAIAAIVVGPISGLVCGAAFGINSCIRAFMGIGGLTTALTMINPVALIFTTVVTRALDGLLVGYIFRLLHDKCKLKKLSYYLAAVCAPLLNTLFFMTCLVVFFYNSEPIQNLVTKLGAANPFMFVILLVGIQGLIEAAAGLLIGGAVSHTLSYAINRRNSR